MSNTRTARPVATKTAATKKLGKWATLRAEAEKRAAKRPARPKVNPYTIDDIEPPIVITPPDDKRMLIISECIGPDGTFHISRVMPLLRALCGDQFGRVWQMIPNDSPEASDMMMLLTQELVDHFISVLDAAMEASELPGGSEGSSN